MLPIEQTACFPAAHKGFYLIFLILTHRKVPPLSESNGEGFYTVLGSVDSGKLVDILYPSFRSLLYNSCNSNSEKNTRVL